MPTPHQLTRFFSKQGRSTVLGFTLLEILVVCVITTILAAIAVPAWLHFVNVMSLNAGQEQVLLAMRKAQHNAKLNHIIWEFGIRQNPDGLVQWAIYPGQPATPPTLWHDLDARLQIDPETSLREVAGIRRVQFNHLGAVNGQLGRVTLAIKNGGRTKRCVIVSTLLGALRTGSDQSRPVDGKYCR